MRLVGYYHNTLETVSQLIDVITAKQYMFQKVNKMSERRPPTIGKPIHVMRKSLKEEMEERLEFYYDNPGAGFDDLVYYAGLIDEAYELMIEEGDSVLRTSVAGRKWLENYKRITEDE